MGSFFLSEFSVLFSLFLLCCCAVLYFRFLRIFFGLKFVVFAVLLYRAVLSLVVPQYIQQGYQARKRITLPRVCTYVRTACERA